MAGLPGFARPSERHSSSGPIQLASGSATNAGRGVRVTPTLALHWSGFLGSLAGAVLAEPGTAGSWIALAGLLVLSRLAVGNLLPFAVVTLFLAIGPADFTSQEATRAILLPVYIVLATLYSLVKLVLVVPRLGRRVDTGAAAGATSVVGGSPGGGGDGGGC